MFYYLFPFSSIQRTPENRSENYSACELVHTSWLDSTSSSSPSTLHSPSTAIPFALSSRHRSRRSSSKRKCLKTCWRRLSLRLLVCAQYGHRKRSRCATYVHSNFWWRSRPFLLAYVRKQYGQACRAIWYQPKGGRMDGDEFGECVLGEEWGAWKRKKERETW